MPKTQIELPTSGTVTVGWTKLGAAAEYMQIGVDRLPQNGNPEIAAFVDFSGRRQVNDLIRALRKARDEAFGRDE